MVKLIHHSPLGALDIPGVGTVEAGEVFEVDAGTAKQLLQQSELYSESKPAEAKKAATTTEPNNTNQGDTK
jgi:hypothetical protein